MILNTRLPYHRILAKSLFPSIEDDEVLRSNFSVLISRVLVEHMSFFAVAFKDIVPSHIPHVHNIEMSYKSEVVS